MNLNIKIWQVVLKKLNMIISLIAWPEDPPRLYTIYNAYFLYCLLRSAQLATEQLFNTVDEKNTSIIRLLK